MSEKSTSTKSYLMGIALVCLFLTSVIMITYMIVQNDKKTSGWLCADGKAPEEGACQYKGKIHAISMTAEKEWIITLPRVAFSDGRNPHRVKNRDILLGSEADQDQSAVLAKRMISLGALQSGKDIVVTISGVSGEYYRAAEISVRSREQ